LDRDAIPVTKFVLAPVASIAGGIPRIANGPVTAIETVPAFPGPTVLLEI
jgi:hypothetical protein